MPELHLFEPSRSIAGPATRKPRDPCDWQPGDLVLFWGRGWQSRCIELFTRGPSHVGLIILVEGRPLLYESTTLCDLPCEIAKRRVEGVQAHTPDRRIASYDGAVSRLPIKSTVWPEDANHLTRVALTEFPCGTPYALGAALGSGPKLKDWRAFLPYPDLASIFCSALCARLLQEIHKMNRSDPTRWSPADLVNELRRTATHGPPHPVKLAPWRIAA